MRCVRIPSYIICAGAREQRLARVIRLCLGSSEGAHDSLLRKIRLTSLCADEDTCSVQHHWPRASRLPHPVLEQEGIT